jgi:uncharacterized protein (TIGR00369 family)
MKRQSNSKKCFVCGVENTFGLQVSFFEEEPGKTSANVTVSKHFQGYPGIVHGGIIAALLDEAAGRTIMQGDAPRWMVTAKLSVRYRRPVPVEKPLKLTGQLIEDNGMTVKAISEIRDSENQLLAEGEVLLANIPASVKQNFADLPPDEWMVYRD